MPTALSAAPYCNALLDTASLPDDLRRLAPIHNSADTGWVFTADMFPDQFHMWSETQRLVTQIAAEFATQNLPLAVVVTPPRPLVAGAEVLNATLAPGTIYDAAAGQTSFNWLIEGLQQAGVIAPNLLDTALASAELREEFYFHRDTHWTPTGAGASAFALAAEVAARQPDLFDGITTDLAAKVTGTEPYEEKGSLNRVVEEVCGTGGGLEIVPAQIYAAPEGLGLFGDAPDRPKIALLGSSFSDRYARDAYRFSDALSAAFNADVDNFSISGGGAIGAIESFVYSGALQNGDYAMAVWELPYTQNFNSTSNLRQLLGALRAQRLELTSAASPLPSFEASVFSMPQNTLAPVVLVRDPGKTFKRFSIDVMLEDGRTRSIKMARPDAVTGDARAATWATYIGDADNQRIVAIRVDTRGGGEAVLEGFRAR